MPETLTETVTLDRQAVMELLVEAHAVADVFETIAGVCPTELTDRLTQATERIAHDILGECAPNLDEGPRFELWVAGEQRRDELMGRSRVEHAPPVIQALAAGLEEGGVDG